MPVVEDCGGGQLILEAYVKVASLVTGILSIVFCFIPAIGLILGLIAIITAKKEPSGQIAGMSAAGLTCGIIGLVICAIITLVAGCSTVAMMNL